MFTAFTPEEEQPLKGEFLDWTQAECKDMSGDQFMTAQAACAQAWAALRAYMRDTPESVFRELCEQDAPYRLSRAIIATCAEKVQRTVDQLCDTALTSMGFLLVRDEFGVHIVGDSITFAQAVR